MVATVDKKSKRELARIEERERAGTELGQPGADQFKGLRAAEGPVETYTLAVVSTAHLKPGTATALEKSRGYPYGPLVSVFEDGFFVSFWWEVPPSTLIWKLYASGRASAATVTCCWTVTPTRLTACPLTSGR